MHVIIRFEQLVVHLLLGLRPHALGTRATPNWGYLIQVAVTHFLRGRNLSWCRRGVLFERATLAREHSPCGYQSQAEECLRSPPGTKARGKIVAPSYKTKRAVGHCPQRRLTGSTA